MTSESAESEDSGERQEGWAALPDDPPQRRRRSGRDQSFGLASTIVVLGLTIHLPPSATTLPTTCSSRVTVLTKVTFHVPVAGTQATNRSVAGLTDAVVSIMAERMLRPFTMR